MMTEKPRQSILAFCFVVLIVVPLLLSGCGNSYSYDKLRDQAESALRKGKIRKARKIFAKIFRLEKKATPLVKSHLHWAFYRLGVIHEVLNKRALAKGYYWGDQFDKGYYADSPRIAWLAQTGWEWLDLGIPPRSLKKILELEALKSPLKRRSAKRVKAHKKPVSVAPVVTNRKGRPLRSYDRALNRPPANVAQPFKVFY